MKCAGIVYSFIGLTCFVLSSCGTDKDLYFSRTGKTRCNGDAVEYFDGTFYTWMQLEDCGQQFGVPCIEDGDTAYCEGHRDIDTVPQDADAENKDTDYTSDKDSDERPDFDTDTNAPSACDIMAYDLTPSSVWESYSVIRVSGEIVSDYTDLIPASGSADLTLAGYPGKKLLNHTQHYVLDEDIGKLILYVAGDPDPTGRNMTYMVVLTPVDMLEMMKDNDVFSMEQAISSVYVMGVEQLSINFFRQCYIAINSEPPEENFEGKSILCHKDNVTFSAGEVCRLGELARLSDDAEYVKAYFGKNLCFCYDEAGSSVPCT